ncbi:MAG: response regulator [Phycisphaeraceae bacterium]|nr:response regulator [Phycisphaeraceae bacterium]
MTTNADLIHRSLSRSNRPEVIRTDCLSDVRKAIERKAFHVILLDLNLPDSNGLDTVRSVRQAPASTPLVVLTTHDDFALSSQALNAGAQDCVPKGELPA